MRVAMSPFFAIALFVGEPAIAVSVVGEVELDDGSATRALARFDEVPLGATVITHADSLATLRLPEGSQLRLAPETRLTIGTLTVSQPVARRSVRLRLVVGRIWAGVMNLFGKEASFDVETENAVAGVRGTAFWVSTGEGGDEYVLDHGSLQVSSKEARVALDGPGAVVRMRTDGFDTPERLPPRQLAALRLSVGGPGAALDAVFSRVMREAAPRWAAQAATHLPRRGFEPLEPPSSLLDSPIAGRAAGEQIRGMANVTIRVRPPTSP
jgi:hypothetical protein